MKPLGDLGRRDQVVLAPHQQRRHPELAEPLLEVVALGRPRRVEHANRGTAVGDDTADRLDPLVAAT
ncbi:MAG: hypothetical protein DMD96_32670 [Candidatus Rokuibacteriota bacterium]|nr:MAG: hypothetical protein DMD96_32670 [Candidatus Rokubacteria bacterium]